LFFAVPRVFLLSLVAVFFLWRLFRDVSLFASRAVVLQNKKGREQGQQEREKTAKGSVPARAAKAVIMQ
jgi:hypothetical protein